jgi:hypothetical protein
LERQLSLQNRYRKDTEDTAFSGSANGSGASPVPRIIAVGKPLVGATNFREPPRPRLGR